MSLDFWLGAVFIQLHVMTAINKIMGSADACVQVL